MQDRIKNREEFIRKIKGSDIRLNEIQKHRAKGDSEFKIHLYIRNVFIPRSNETCHFLAYILDRVGKVFTPSFVQLGKKIDEEFYDIALGFKHDQEAIDYMVHHKRKILIQTIRGNLEEHDFQVSQAFRVYLEHRGLKIARRQRSRSSERNAESPVSRSFCKILLLGIPEDVQKKDILKSIKTNDRPDLNFDSCNWKSDCFQIILKKDLYLKDILQTPLFIDDIPILILKSDRRINEQLVNYQLQVKAHRRLDSIQIFRILRDFGTIVRVQDLSNSIFVVTFHCQEASIKAQRTRIQDLSFSRPKQGHPISRSKKQQHIVRCGR